MTRSHEKGRRDFGFALPAVIGALVIIGILVTAGFFMARQELRMGVASHNAHMALNVAQMGANEVMANWNGYQLGNIPVWSSTTVNGTNSVGTWSVKIENANNFVYFLTASGTVTKGGPLWAGATRTIGLNTKILFADIEPPAALTTRGSVKVGGTSNVLGNDVDPNGWGSVCTSIPNVDNTGILVDSANGGTNPMVQGGGQLTGNPPTAENLNLVDSSFTNFGEMNWAELTALAIAEGKNITSLGSVINSITPTVVSGRCDTADLRNWGDSIPTNLCGSYFPLIYHGGNLSLQSANYGQGVLLVQGNLELRGGFTFVGIIITQGTFSTGTGVNRVFGAVMASNGGDLNQSMLGTSTIQYSGCGVMRSILNNASLSRARPLDVRSWVDLTNSTN